jgi:hypothetical protein
MSQISPPEKGQPLDVDYIYQIVTTLNSLNNALATSKNATSYIAGNDGNITLVNTSSLQFFSKTIAVNFEGTVTAGRTLEVDVEFPKEFKTLPIVTATPYIRGAISEANKNVVVTTVSTTLKKTKLLLTCQVAGSISIDVGVLALGLSLQE